MSGKTGVGIIGSGTKHAFVSHFNWTDGKAIQVYSQKKSTCLPFSSALI
jgi:hypothetical protein